MSDNRADSSHVQTEIMQEAFKDVKPPSCITLEPKHLPYWYAIIQARHKWNEIDLFHAANLARTLCMIEEETILLSMQGSTIKNDRGTPVMNPKFGALQTLTTRACTLSQKLQIHAQATMGNPRDQRNKNSKKQDVLEAFEDDEDDLIAKPVN